MQPDGGNSVRGEELFRLYVPEARYACISCHLPDSTQTLLGPGLRDIGVSAARCDPEQSLEDYLRESLLEPDVCLVPGYTAAVMPSVYAELWSEPEIERPRSLAAYPAPVRLSQPNSMVSSELLQVVWPGL